MGARLNVWRTRALIAAGVLLALVGAFTAGRFSAPEQVQTTSIVTKTVRVVERVEVKGETVYVKAKAQIVWRDRVVKPDGTITEHIVEKTDTKEDGKISVSSNTDRNVSLAENRTDTRTVTVRPRWRLSVLAGAQYPPPLLTIAGPLVLGAQFEIRIAGGLSAGLWATTGAAGGLVISFEF